MSERISDSMRVPDLAPVKVDRSKPHYTFRLPAKFITEGMIPYSVHEMVAIGRFADARMETDRHIALELNGERERMRAIMESIRENITALLDDRIKSADEPEANDNWQFVFKPADGFVLQFEAPNFDNSLI